MTVSNILATATVIRNTIIFFAVGGDEACLGSAWYSSIVFWLLLVIFLLRSRWLGFPGCFTAYYFQFFFGRQSYRFCCLADTGRF